jgi:hypothetical protein
MGREDRLFIVLVVLAMLGAVVLIAVVVLVALMRLPRGSCFLARRAAHNG